MPQPVHQYRAFYFVLIAATLLALLCPCLCLRPDQSADKTAEEDPYGPIVGIDLGSTHSRIAVVRDDKVEVISTILSSLNPQPLDVMREDVTSKLLLNLKERAEVYLSESITHAVITVPDRYCDAERQEIRLSARSAGLEALRIVNKPAAVANAYALTEIDGGSHVLIFDLGGMTCDAALLWIEDGVYEILASASDSDIGGERLTDRLVEHLVRQYESQTGLAAPAGNSEEFSELRQDVERAKRSVAQRSAWQEIHEIPTFNGEDGYITQYLFEHLSEDLFARSIDLVEQVLSEANVTTSEVDKVILAGGSSRIARIRALLQDFVGIEPTQDINPEEAAVCGAALYGNVLRFEQPDLCTCCGWPLWPYPLGIETCDGIVKYIPIMPVVPFRRTYTFTTAEDYQTSVRIALYSGERAYAKDSLLVESFELRGIAPAPRGIPRIEVTVEVDTEYYMRVSALDRGSNGTASVGLSVADDVWSSDDFVRIVRDAEPLTEDEAKIITDGELCLPSGQARAADDASPRPIHYEL